MGISAYLDDKILDHIFRNTDYAHVATVYVSLHTADPGTTGASEVTGGSYVREAITWGAAAGAVISNSALITFTTATADWGVVTHLGIWDAETAGNFLCGDEATVSKNVVSGSTPKIQIGDLDVTIA